MPGNGFHWRFLVYLVCKIETFWNLISWAILCSDGQYYLSIWHIYSLASIKKKSKVVACWSIIYIVNKQQVFVIFWKLSFIVLCTLHRFYSKKMNLKPSNLWSCFFFVSLFHFPKRAKNISWLVVELSALFISCLFNIKCALVIFVCTQVAVPVRCSLVM